MGLSSEKSKFDADLTRKFTDMPLAASTSNMTALQRLTVSEKVQYVPTVAGGSDIDSAIFDVPRDMKLLSAKYIPHAAVTAHATNNFTLFLKVSTTTKASIVLDTPTTDDWTDNTTVTLTVADSDLDKGDVLRLVKTEAGTGLALPAGVLQLELVERMS